MEYRITEKWREYLEAYAILLQMLGENNRLESPSYVRTAGEV